MSITQKNKQRSKGMLSFKSFTGFASIVVLTASIMIWGQHAAHATLVTTSFNGTVTLDNGGVNPFGLNIGDMVSGSATYDNVLVQGVSPNDPIKIDGKPGWNFSVTLGSFSFTQANVTDPTFTGFFFDNGVLGGMAFFIEPIDIGTFTNLLIEDFCVPNQFFVDDATTGTGYLDVNWDYENAVTRQVPLPGMLALFGVGLVSLGVVVMRRKTV